MKRYGIYESGTRWQNGHYQSTGGTTPPAPPKVAEDGNIIFKFSGNITNPATDTRWLLPYDEYVFRKTSADFDKFDYSYLQTSLFIEKELHRIDYRTGDELTLLTSSNATYDNVTPLSKSFDVDYYLAFLYKFVYATNSAGQIAAAFFTPAAGNYISNDGQYGTYTSVQTAPATRLYFGSALKQAVDSTPEFNYSMPNYITNPTQNIQQIQFMGTSPGYQLVDRRWVRDNSTQNNVQQMAVHRSSVFCPMPIGKSIMDLVTLTTDYSCNYNLPGMIRAFVGNYVKDERTSTAYYQRPLHVPGDLSGEFECRFYNMMWDNITGEFLRGLMFPRLYTPVIMANSRCYSGYSLMNGIVGMFVLVDKYGRIRYNGDVQ